MSSSPNEPHESRDINSPDGGEEGDEDNILWLGCLGEDEDDMDEGPSFASTAELEKQLLETIVHNEEEAYMLYCYYAHGMGFSVRKWKQYYFPGTKKIKSKMFCCSKEGVKDDGGDANGTGKKLETRTGCRAMVYFTCDDNGLWKVTRFVKEHNHEMAQPYERNMLRSVRLVWTARGCMLDPRSARVVGNSREAICLDNDKGKIVCLHCKGRKYMNDQLFDAYIQDLEEQMSGQVLYSEEGAYRLYCDYARLKGFSVRRGKQYYFWGSNRIKWKSYCCSKEGAKVNTNGAPCNKIDTRTGCKAKISFSCDNEGQWKVTAFVKEHNHEMAKPHERSFPRSACSNAKERFTDSGQSFKRSGNVSLALKGDLVLQPQEGMLFESIDAAKSFYDEYAKQLGFVACQQGCNKEERCCSIGGIFGLQDNLHASMNEDCMAMILLQYGKSGKWLLAKYVKDHNHPLLTLPRQFQHTVDEKDKRIEELTAELRNKKRLCTMYQEQLNAFMDVVGDHCDHLSKKAGFMVDNVKEYGQLGEELALYG